MFLEGTNKQIIFFRLPQQNVSYMILRPDIYISPVYPLFLIIAGLQYIHPLTLQHIGLPRWYSGKESACQYRRHWRRGFDPWLGKIP